MHSERDKRKNYSYISHDVSLANENLMKGMSCNKEDEEHH